MDYGLGHIMEPRNHGLMDLCTSGSGPLDHVHGGINMDLLIHGSVMGLSGLVLEASIQHCTMC